MQLSSKTKVVLVLIVIIILFLLFYRGKTAGVSQNQGQVTEGTEVGDGKQDPQNQALAQDVIAKVKKHIDLSLEGEPTVATIIDAEKLKEKNPFYAKAQNGDYLVVTQTRAILYDPNADVLLDVVPVQIQQPASSKAASSAPKVVPKK